MAARRIESSRSVVQRMLPQTIHDRLSRRLLLLVLTKEPVDQQSSDPIFRVNQTSATRLAALRSYLHTAAAACEAGGPDLAEFPAC